MADHNRRDEAVDGGGIPEGPEHREQSGSPLGTDPQEATPLPGDPREPQETQEPRSSHVAREDDSDQGVVDQLRAAWDRMLGKK